MLTFYLIIAWKTKLLQQQQQQKTLAERKVGLWGASVRARVCGSSGGIQKMLFADDQPAGRERTLTNKEAKRWALCQVYYSSSGPPLHPSTPNAELSDFLTDKRTAGEGREVGLGGHRMRGAGRRHRSEPLRGGVMDGHNIPVVVNSHQNKAVTFLSLTFCCSESSERERERKAQCCTF